MRCLWLARVTRRPARVPRTPPNGRPDIRSAAIPSAAVRRRRGPQPPDRVVAQLRVALEIELAEQPGALVVDAAPPVRLGAVWKAAVNAAARAIGIGARRGVVSALPPGSARERARTAALPSARSWVGRVTKAVLKALRSAVNLLAAGMRAASRWVFREHTRQVMLLSIAAGVSHYVWTTRRDSRVRPLHVRLDATVQRWDDPPLAGLPDFFGHPGEAGGCRCMPFPIVRETTRTQSENISIF